MAMGLKNSPTSPFQIFGHLIEGEPPIYIGIYVDDILYFSTSDKFKSYFEDSLSKLWQVEFMGQVSYFLSIEFTWKYHRNGHLTASLPQQFSA